MKKIFFIFFIAGLLIFSLAEKTDALTDSSPLVTNGQQEIIIHFFYGEGCTYCKQEEDYLKILKNRYPSLVIEKHEVWNDEKNSQLMEELSFLYGEKNTAVPLAFIGEKMLVGYLGEAVTGKALEEEIKKCLENFCRDPFSKVETRKPTVILEEIPSTQDSETISLPDKIVAFIGGIILIGILSALLYKEFKSKKTV